MFESSLIRLYEYTYILLPLSTRQVYPSEPKLACTCVQVAESKGRGKTEAASNPGWK